MLALSPIESVIKRTLLLSEVGNLEEVVCCCCVGFVCCDCEDGGSLDGE